MRLIEAALPRPPQEHTNWPAIGALLPHALAATEAAEWLGAGLDTAATILNETALYHHARAAWAEAEPLYQRAIAILDKSLPPDHPNLATARENYAVVYSRFPRAASVFHEFLSFMLRAVYLLVLWHSAH